MLWAVMQTSRAIDFDCNRLQYCNINHEMRLAKGSGILSLITIVGRIAVLIAICERIAIFIAIFEKIPYHLPLLSILRVPYRA